MNTDINIKLFVLLIILIVALSCTKQVEIEIPVVPPRPVVNAFFSPDSNLSINLCKSSGVFETNFPEIPNAIVVLYCNDAFADTLIYSGNGNYNSNHIPTAGNSYKISVFTDEFGEVSAEDFIPSKPLIKSAIRTDNYGVDIYGSSYSLLELEFYKNPEGVNFYEVILSFDSLLFVVGPDTSYINGIAGVCTDDPIAVSDAGNSDCMKSKNLVFCDEFITSETYKIYIKYYPMMTPHLTTEYNLYVNFHSISENYFNYIKKRNLYYNNTQSLMNNDGEIVRLYSNVSNGYGIFAGFNSQILKLKQ